MKISGWLKPLWGLLAGVVKAQLHALVESVDESDIFRFKLRLHEKIDRL